MRVKLFVAADYANVADNGKLNIMGIFDRIQSDKFPARHPSMFLVIKLSADLGEYDTDHDFRIMFLNTDGNELGAIEGGARFGRPENAASTLMIVRCQPLCVMISVYLSIRT
jgi:hypothetical protein